MKWWLSTNVDATVTLKTIVNTEVEDLKILKTEFHLLLSPSAETEEFQGAELVNLRLLALTREERLLFSPNLGQDGLKALRSQHGLVLVAVAGTIHRDDACLGLFDQMFGLIRSPMVDNSWKIKNVDLKIKGRDALKGPVTSAPALGYSSGELQLLCS